MKRRPMSLLKLKKKEKKKQKEKDKKKKRKKIATLCPETRARSEGYMVKVFKARCPKQIGWEPPT